jgi:DnaJ-class molecular chaperone
MAEQKTSKPVEVPAQPARQPGDEARAGAGQTGMVTCPTCQGSGKRGQTTCPDCGGRGQVVRIVGDA